MRVVDRLMLLVTKLRGQDVPPEANIEARLDQVDKRLDRLTAVGEAFKRADRALHR